MSAYHDALRTAIEALLIEQREREAVIEQLMALAQNGNGHAQPKRKSKRIGSAHRTAPRKQGPKARIASMIELPRGVRDGGPTARLFQLLAERGPLRQPEIRAALNMGGSNVTSALKVLRQHKLVKVSGPDRKQVYAVA